MSVITARRSRLTAAAVVATLGLSAVGAAPAFADTGTWFNGGDSGATVTVPDAVVAGDSIRLEGTGWLDGKADNDANGSWIAVKLGAAGGIEGDVLTTEPAAGRFTFPGSTTGTGAVWTGIVADDAGDFSVDIPFPTGANTNPQLATEWAPGTTHHLQLLTGSVKPTGDTVRSVYVTFTVAEDTLSVTARSGGRGAPAGQTTLAVVAADGTFAADEALTAQVDGVDAAWASGGTASATGALASTSLVFAAGELRAGDHSVTITGATSGTKTRTVTVLPTAAFSALAQGSEGTLTLSNLPAGSSVAGVSFADVAFAALPAAEVDGVATIAYSIPATATLGTYPVTVTLANPSVSFELSGQKISPDATIFGDDAFTLASNGEGIFQGLYQSAYSAQQDALFVAAASGTGSNEDGYLYKVDPDTLEVIASVHPKDVVDGDGVAGTAPYGVGVDDVNGKVWVSNTRTAGVAVYDADDLTLIKQFPTGTTSHSRDVVYDPLSNRVFVTSASEGTSGDGYISVFDAVTLEKITDLQTGARTEFSPVSLDLDNGVLVSPSLSTNKVIKINTQTLDFSFLEISGINVGGRGASGIDYVAETNRLYIASQNSDELVIADATTGATLAEVPTGTGALNVEVDEVNELVYVTNLSGGTVTVTDYEGEKVANLPIVRANHVTSDGAGTVYIVDKNTENKVWRVTLNEVPVDPTDPEVPVDPTDPEVPVDPTDPEVPVDPTDPEVPVEPTLPGTSGSIDTIPASADLTAETKNLVTGPATAQQGQTISVQVGSARAGHQVHGWVFSEPKSLGIHTVTAAGAISLAIPADLAAGAHRIAVTGTDGAVIGWFDLTVTAPDTLAVTGGSFDGWLGAGVAVMLLLLGAAIVVTSRRRNAQV